MVSMTWALARDAVKVERLTRAELRGILCQLFFRLEIEDAREIAFGRVS